MSLRKLYDLMVPENDGTEEYAPLRLGWCTGALMGPAREVTLVWRSDGVYMDPNWQDIQLKNPQREGVRSVRNVVTYSRRLAES